jgi:hypothetical protein
LPVFRNHTILEIMRGIKVRGIKAFLRARSQANRQLRNKNREVLQIRSRLGSEVGENAKANSILEQNIVWMFCSERTGSTWLASMMGDLQEHATWNEPLVGLLFGRFYNARTYAVEQ